MWKTKHLPLTDEQRKRDVVFSSELIVTNVDDIEPSLHEVFDGQVDQDETIARLKDVKFFKDMAKEFGYDVEEIIRS